MTRLNKEKGFVALISVILICASLLLIATTLSYTGFYARANGLDSEYKERSSAFAEACGDQTLLSLTNDSAYTGNATTTINGVDKCYTYPVTTSGALKTFETRGIYQNHYTYLKIIFDTSTQSVQSWEELPKF
jgi:hypothetical protein